MAKQKDDVSKSKLRAISPKEVRPSKPRFLISGKSGIGKTMFALDFPRPYLIDCEGGAIREQYQAKLRASDGAYMGKEHGSQDFDVVIEEIKNLITTKHPYKTLIIDSFSYLYNLEAARAEAEGGSDFGRDKKEANKPTRQLIRWLEKLDMNVILICHSKDKWMRVGKDIINQGTTFDGYEKLEYILDLWIELLRGRKFEVRKSRIVSLPQDEVFDLKYEKFAELYGKDTLESASVEKALATPEQISEVKALQETVKHDPKIVDKMFKKEDADEWEDFSFEHIQAAIDWFKGIEKATKGEK